jgi:hypothetical protein
MRRLNTRAPRIAGLLALALGAVALLAVSGVAAAKGHGNDDNGHHHGRHHHHHGRHHDRLLEMREAGTISSFDPSTGKLAIALLEGGTVTGLVTEGTEIRCEGVDDRRDHGGGDDNGGHFEPGDDHGGRGEPEPGDDNGGETPEAGAAEGEAGCSTASLVPGALVGDTELRLEGGGAVFEEVELGHHS